MVSFSYHFQFKYTLIWCISSQHDLIYTKQLFKKKNIFDLYVYTEELEGI